MALILRSTSTLIRDPFWMTSLAATVIAAAALIAAPASQASAADADTGSAAPASASRNAAGEPAKSPPSQPAATPAPVAYKGDGMKQDSLALAIVAAAKSWGRDVDYADVIFAAGTCFAPVVDVDEDCMSWWHVQAWANAPGVPLAAARAGLTARELVGKLTFPKDDGERGRQYQAVAAAARPEIAGDAQVLALGGFDWKSNGMSWCWAGLLTDVRDDAPSRGASLNGRGDNPLATLPPLWSLRPGRPLAEDNIDRLALRQAVMRIHGGGAYAPAEKRLYGLAAVDRWIAQMETVPGFCKPCAGRPSQRSWSDAMDNARRTHGGAVESAAGLRKAAPRMPEAIRAHLLAAAAHYENIAALLEPFTSDAPVVQLAPSPGAVAALDLGSGVTMSFVRIAPGSVTPKDSGRPVALGSPLYVGTTHVTRRQFAAFVAQAGHQTDAEKQGFTYGVRPGTVEWEKIVGGTWKAPGFAASDEHAVTCISDRDAEAFCAWLGKKTGRTLRLPTDAEWEYACRGGATSKYFWGDEAAAGTGFMNAEDGVSGWHDGFRFTSPAAQFRPNAFGLYDMLGQLWQPTVSRDAAGRRRYTVRGGTWDYPAAMNRVGFCVKQDTDTGQSWDSGFRVVMEVDTQRAREGKGYKAFIGDLGAQKTHATTVLRPVRAELAEAGRELALAAAKIDDIVTLNGHVYELHWVTGENTGTLGLAGDKPRAARAPGGPYAAHVNPLYNLHCEIGPLRADKDTDAALKAAGQTWGEYWAAMARDLKRERFALLATVDGGLAGHVRFFRSDFGRLRDVPAELRRRDALLVTAACVDAMGAADGLDAELVRRVIEQAREQKFAAVQAVGWPDARALAMWGEGLPTSIYDAACFARRENFAIEASVWRDITSGSHGAAARGMAAGEGTPKLQRHLVELDFSRKVDDPRFR